MISSRKLMRMAKKWQRKAALGRKHITFPKSSSSSSSSSSSQVAEKGHVIVYKVDQKRYSFPISYLNNYIFRELFRMAKEEFGVPSDGPITIPSEVQFMDYFFSLLQKGSTLEIEKALLPCISSCRVSSSHEDRIQHNPQLYCR